MIKCKAKNRQLSVTIKGELEEVLLDTAAVTSGIVHQIMKQYGMTRRQVFDGIENVCQRYMKEMGVENRKEKLWNNS